jgi:ATP-dependent DNA ligase
VFHDDEEENAEDADHVLAAMDSSSSSSSSSSSASVARKDLQLCYQVFDIVLLNGESVMNRPLRERRQLLMQSVKPEPHRLEVVLCNSSIVMDLQNLIYSI